MFRGPKGTKDLFEDPASLILNDPFQWLTYSIDKSYTTTNTQRNKEADGQKQQEQLYREHFQEKDNQNNEQANQETFFSSPHTPPQWHLTLETWVATLVATKWVAT